MLPRVAFEYGQVWCASSTSALARSRSTSGRLMLSRRRGSIAVRQIQIHFGVDGDAGRQSDFSLVGGKRDRAFETGRPTGSKQLLRVRADARGTRSRKLDVQTVIGATGYAVFSARLWCGSWPCTAVFRRGLLPVQSWARSFGVGKWRGRCGGTTRSRTCAATRMRLGARRKRVPAVPRPQSDRPCRPR